MRALIGFLISAVSCCAASAAFGHEPLSGNIFSGLYRLLPHDPQRNQELERFYNEDPYKAYFPEPSNPVLPFVNPSDKAKFAVVVGGEEKSSRKILLLSERQPKLPDEQADIQTSGGQGKTRSDTGVGCIAFGFSTVDQSCPVGDAFMSATLSGNLLVGSYYTVYKDRYGPSSGSKISMFELVAVKKYIDIVRMPRPSLLYVAPSWDSKNTMNLQAGEFAAVISYHPEWARVEVHRSDGTATQGWLTRRDLVDGEWVKQAGSDGKHTFRVAHKTYGGQLIQGSEEFSSWHGIEVRSLTTGAKYYVFEGAGEGRLGEPSSLISLTDVNFDGHLDLKLFGHDGGAGPNSADVYYLYDPVSDRFVYHDQLSSMTQLEFNSARKTLQTAWRASCCEHGWEEYRWKNGELLKVAAGNDRYLLDEDGTIEITRGQLVNGKWRETIRRKVEKEQARSAP